MEYEFILRIFIAALLGSLIGLEREYRSKEAGFRTHFLVAMGSALFMIVSAYGFQEAMGDDDLQRVEIRHLHGHIPDGIPAGEGPAADGADLGVQGVEHRCDVQH